jgi:hypothetical protein
LHEPLQARNHQPGNFIRELH